MKSAVDRIRRFNRFYTRRIGVLQKTFLDSDYSLAEVRILYELAHRRNASATEIARELGADPGYLSRMLKSFERRGLVRRHTSDSDGRKSLLDLSSKGRAAFEALDEKQRAEVAAMLQGISREAREKLMQATRVIEHVLNPQPGSPLHSLYESPGRETSAGSSRGTARFTRRNTVGTNNLKPW